MNGFADDIFTVTRIVKVKAKKPKPRPIKRIYEWMASTKDYEDTWYFDTDNLEEVGEIEDDMVLQLKMWVLDKNTGEVLDTGTADYNGVNDDCTFDNGDAIPKRFNKQYMKWVNK